MSHREILPIGTRLSRWTVVGEPLSVNQRTHFLCRCDCGAERVIASTQLRFKKSHSCGCLQLDRVTKHGAARRNQRASEYATWLQMRHRCSNKNDPSYADYGGRGIRVAAEWDDYSRFIADMGSRSKGHSLDRINNDGNYCKENCRWTTIKVQQGNKRTSVALTHAGKTLSLKDWAIELGIPYSTLQYRYQAGQPVTQILVKENRRSMPRQTRSPLGHRP